MTLNLATETRGIGDVLASKKLAVPEHQRSFAWKVDQVTALWDDLVRAEVDEPDGYFLGQLVLSDPAASSQLPVIDGQQRLATVSLFFAAAVRLLQDRGDVVRANHYRSKFLLGLNPLTLEHQPRLRLTADDDVFFKSLVVAVTEPVVTQFPVATRESHELLAKAYEVFVSKLALYVDSAGPATWVLKLVRILDFLEESVEVIVIQVGSDQNAYLIFETLNDRGVRLTTADLLKNKFYGEAGQQLAVVQSEWTRMGASLDVLNDDDAITTFLRHYWISTIEHVREKELYKKIRATISTPSKAVELATGLAASADTYAALLNPSDPRWTSTAVRSSLDLLRLFRVSTVRPLLLAIAETTSGNQQRQLISAVAGWSMRLAVAGGLGTGSTEEALGNAARWIRTANGPTVNDLRTQLGGIVVDDVTFLNAFANYRVANHKQSRFLLAALERQAKLDSGTPLEQVPNLDESVVNLEHIMPRNPNLAGPWATIAATDQYKGYVNRLGNHALMLLADNVAIGNEDFTEKVAAYAQSSLTLTSQLATLATFDFNEITVRQTNMGALAVKVWPA